MHSELFLVYIMPNKTPVTQLGIVVSKKVKKGAVDRNRIRRRLREAFARVHKKNGVKVVIIPTARVMDTPFKNLTEELKKALH